MLHLSRLSHQSVMAASRLRHHQTALPAMRAMCSSTSSPNPAPAATPSNSNVIPEGATVVTSGSRGAKVKSSWLSTQWKIYSELAKFRLSSLVVVTSGAGFICAGAPLDLPTMATACIGTGLCAASAGTFNQVMERDIDRQMKRTQARPLPSGEVSAEKASVFGGLMGLSGVSLLLATTNPLTAALGAGNILLYAPIYTYSKRFTELNTWIGSIVGAIPPVMGWTAAGGSLMAAEPWALASLLFLWQFPHFFALSWLHREDYARGNFAMVPVNDPTGVRTAGLIQEYSLYLAAFPIVASALGWTSYMFAVEGTIANAYLLMLSRKFSQERSNAQARRIFLCSLWYLPLLLAAYVFHSRMWEKNKLTNEATEEGEDQITDVVLHAKEALKSICVHEMLASSETHSAPHLCLKVASEEALENTNITVVDNSGVDLTTSPEEAKEQEEKKQVVGEEQAEAGNA